MGLLTENPLYQQDAYRVTQRRAKAAGIETHIGNHTFRATGVTAYLKNSGKLEVAQQIANHESPRTTKLYDRRRMRFRSTRLSELRLKNMIDICYLSARTRRTSLKISLVWRAAARRSPISTNRSSTCSIS
jgi:hypothetical protein